MFVIATANDVARLPAEMTRKGRFDETFFVDLPREAERRAILGIHLRKRGRDAAGFDLDRLAVLTDGYTGAEIEEAIISGLYQAFEGKRGLVSEDLVQALIRMVPLSQTRKEELDRLREWARTRARSASELPAQGGAAAARPPVPLELGKRERS